MVGVPDAVRFIVCRAQPCCLIILQGLSPNECRSSSDSFSYILAFAESARTFLPSYSFPVATQIHHLGLNDSLCFIKDKFGSTELDSSITS